MRKVNVDNNSISPTPYYAGGGRHQRSKSSFFSSLAASPSPSPAPAGPPLTESQMEQLNQVSQMGQVSQLGAMKELGLSPSFPPASQVSGGEVRSPSLCYPQMDPIKEEQNSLFSLNVKERRKKVQHIETENVKLAQKLFNAKSTIPRQKDLHQRYKQHQQTKGLRCRFPIVNMRYN